MSDQKSTANNPPSPRCVAIMGTPASGKTTLLEAILLRCGAMTRHGNVQDGTSVGDSSPEARSHQMGVEINVAATTYLGGKITFLDCPGSIEFLQEFLATIAVVDEVVVVCEGDRDKLHALQVTLKYLANAGVPYRLFVNKIDRSTTTPQALLEALQPASPRPLLLRQLPLMPLKADRAAFADLALDRRYVYRDHQASEITIDDADDDAIHALRNTMLETLADHDDTLLESLIEDITPPREQIFEIIKRDFAAATVAPVLIGSALHGHGITRLLKALRHETPDVSAAAARLCGETIPATTIFHVFKTLHNPQSGKLSLGRVMQGDLQDNATLYQGGDVPARISGLFSLFGQQTQKCATATTGEIVALGRLEKITSATTLASDKNIPASSSTNILTPVYSRAITTTQRSDDVKLSAAMHRISEEDQSLTLVHHAELNEIVLCGQGEMHLRIALERLSRKYSITLETSAPATPFRETIRKSIRQRARHKKQSGGHGQFGDVVLDIAPRSRGEGISFNNTIVGGAIPKQYISAVEAGVRDYLQQGPLGFPVVDLAVTLVDGSYHAVDSSDQAFRAAARLAMNDGMKQCAPLILEPVMMVMIMVPAEATPRVNGLITSRRGRLLGFDLRPGWAEWETTQAYLPQQEIDKLIVELRSISHGVGTYSAAFDHYAELDEQLEKRIIAAKIA